MSLDTTSYRRLKFDWPDAGILRITMDNPGRLNSADEIMHGELVRVWRDIDAAEDVRAVIIRGAGVVQTAGSLLQVADYNHSLPSGLGSRHAAAAALRR